VPENHQTNSEERPRSSANSESHRQQSVENGLEVGREIQVENLKLLHQAGVTIVIGSDHAETALAEALHLHQLGVFDNLTLLKMWSETTPQTIFPSRKIGRFEEGFEASFLVLQKNPLEDFKNVQTIKFRFKQGFPNSGEHVSHADAKLKTSY
jgi:imidazolonepropionase-like amidohydrolase